MAHSIAASHAVTGGFVFPIRCRFGSRHRLGGSNRQWAPSATLDAHSHGICFFGRGLFVHVVLMLAPIDVSLSHYLKGGRYYAEDFHCSSVCNCHVSWIGSRNPCAQAHDGGLRRGPAGDCEMPLRYGSRCRPNNLREGAMVPLHGTCLLEVRAPVGRQDSGGLILSHWPSTPVTSQYSPLRLFTPRAR